MKKLVKKKIQNERPSKAALEKTLQKDKLEEEYGYDSNEFNKNATLVNEKNINVKDGNINGLTYFEDNGKDVSMDNEYFNSYFSDEKKSDNHTSIGKTFKNIKIRTGYFMTNVSRLVSKKRRSKTGNPKKENKKGKKQ